MRVVVRCDATRAGGVGHLARSLAIIEAATASGWDVVIVGDIEAPVALEMLAESESRIDIRPSPADEQGLAVLAADLAADVVHVDHYGVGPSLRDRLAPLGIALASMEDGSFGRRPADLVIEPSPAAFAEPRPQDGSRRVVGGARWVPLRSALTRVVPERERAGLAIMLGGTDAFSMSAWCMRRVRAAGYEGSAFAVTADSAAIDVARELGIDAVPPGPDVMRRVARSRFAVIAAGTSLWETVALDVPCAVIAVTENQDLNYARAVDAGAAVGLGRRHVGLDDDAAARALRDAIAEPVRPRDRIEIDGRGAQRIVDAWARIARPATGLAVRDVEEGDASLLFAWRNDPGVRAVSRTGDELQWDSHLSWVRRVIGDPRRLAFVVELDGEPAATVRFDELAAETAAEVSITVAPTHRGRGLGGSVLAETTAEAARRRPEWSRIVAEVRVDNVPSARLFEGAGYVFEGDADEPEFTRWSLALAPRADPS